MDDPFSARQGERQRANDLPWIVAVVLLTVYVVYLFS